MKKFLFLLILFTISLSAQNNKAKYWLDPYGVKVEDRHMMKLAKKYPEYAMGYRKTIDSGMVFQFNSPKYSTYKVVYPIIKKEIENITNKTYSDSTIFLFHFVFYDDYCSDWHSNNMTKKLINILKTNIYYNKKKIEKNNVVFICLFENSIILQNEKQNSKEYFFNDSSNFFRENLFLNSTFCGSFGIIKPNGQTLIRNGEYDILSMSEHLKPKIWELFFSDN